MMRRMRKWVLPVLLLGPAIALAQAAAGGDPATGTDTVLTKEAVEQIISDGVQANLNIEAAAEDLALLASLGEDLKFVFIASDVELKAGAELKIASRPSAATKCERCWHWRDDVGHDAAHPTLCGRCTSNLYGDGESRTVA